MLLFSIVNDISCCVSAHGAATIRKRLGVFSKLGAAAAILGNSASVFLDDPVVLVVPFEAVASHKVLEKLPQVSIVGFFFEFKASAVGKVAAQLFRAPSSQSFDCGRHFLLLDLVVLIVFVLSLQSLPRQSAL